MPTKEEVERMVQKCMRDKGWSRERCQRYIAGGIWGQEYITPTPGDVHIAQPLKKISVKVKRRGETFSISNVPIFKAGRWKDEEWTIEDLDEIVRNTNSLIKSHYIEPPLKLGHNESQVLADGYPALGYVKSIYRLGNQIYANISDVPKRIKDLIEKRAYSKVSAEIYKDFKHPVTQENLGKVLRAVALLGSDIPEIKGLGDIEALYYENYPFSYITFSEQDLKEVNSMGNGLVLEDIKEYLPCCYEEAKLYMEENKKNKITGEDLAIILSRIRLKKLQEEALPECPKGFIWDENLGRCVEQPRTSDLDTNEQERIVCPKGYKWDEAQQRCIPVEVSQENPKLKVPDDIRDLMGVDEIDENDMYDDVEKLQKDLGIIKEQEVEKFQLPGGTPRGWDRRSFEMAFESLGGTFTSCVERVRGRVENPERFCAWMKYRATGEWPGTLEWRAKEEVKVLAEKVKKLEQEKIDRIIDELKVKNRNILLPRFDEYIRIFSEEFMKEDKIVKFKEKKIRLLDLFIDFLKEIVTSKPVIFQELAKNYNIEQVEQEITEEEKDKIIRKYSEIRKEVSLKNLELALMAEKISEKENISYRDALVKARKLLEEKGGD